MFRPTPLALLAFVALAGCGSPAPADEHRPANAPHLQPAFPGQTRAPLVKSELAYQVATAAEGLDRPWAIAFLPDGRMLVTEKPGRLRLVGAQGALSEPAAGLPKVDSRGQGGLLGLAVDPAFAANGLIYWSYAEKHDDGRTNTAVARGRLVADAARPRLEEVKVIFRQTPSVDSTYHYGSRLVFGRDGTLFITLGERAKMEGRVQAQRLDGTLGKVARINPDGSIPVDNPFRQTSGARAEIWSIGHRNVQGAALNPRTGRLWTVEHGARGGDELNIPLAGKDYGWPTISYGIEYTGGAIGDGISQKTGMEQPVYYWDPVIAPSGMAFYEAELFPAWKGSLFIGAMGGMHLARLALDGDRVTSEERLLSDLNERIRDVVAGPDGALYVATDSPMGRILRITPKR